MTDALHGIEEDVPFDHGTCDSLQSLCTTTASTITGQAGSRASAVTTGSTDFKGYFSGLFKDNASTAKADSSELAQSLKDLADFAGQLQAAARTEQARREKARAWKQEMDDRSGLHKAWDDFWGSGEDPPVGPPDAPQDFSPSPPRSGTRTTPAPGSGGGGGGGTSSARPEDLRSFASTSSSLNGELSGKPSRLRSALADFTAQCRWGTLDGSGVVTGFTKWLDANDEDVKWARTVADAFAAAGGEGAVSTLSDSALLATLRAAGVSATRQDITIDPAIAVGHPPTTGYSVDPVNTATGNFLEHEVDLSFTGATSSLLWDRTYNSFTTDTGGFGPGWSSWSETGLELTSESARMRLPDGRVVVFPRLGEGWDRATGENAWLERTGDGFRATGNDGSWFHFDGAGLLRATSAGHDADTLRLEHEDGRLVRLGHVRGRDVELTWHGDRIVRATASDGRAVDYAYDDRGRLVSATGPAGTRGYRWNDDDIVSAVVDADGVVEAENAYDAQRRVTFQRTPHGRVVRFVYLPGNVTVVSDEDGSRSNTWIHDTRGRLIGVVDSDERRQSTSYDGHGNPVLLTERDGAVTVHEYDDRGRRTRTVEPGGGDLTFGYDDADRVTTVVVASGGVVEYSYEGDSRNPSVMVDPEGGRTEMTWSEGLLTRLVDPTGVPVGFGYDDHGDLASTTDALGHTSRLERDACGRVVASVTPLGHRTTYAYDQAGALASRRDPDGATWRFESTTAGRLSAVVDPTGARTELQHGDHGETTRTVDPLGRVVDRALDDLGNLASVELPDGSTWRFAHDALSRLVTTTDPTGAEWRREYDATGEVSATIDPTGVRVGVSAAQPTGDLTVEDPTSSVTWSFDPLGRPTTRTAADGTAEMVVYDLCGHPVEVLDGEGGLTRLERDAAGRVVATTSPAGAVTRYEYDVCGRLAAVVDAVGGRTTYERDADARVVLEVLPTGEVSRTDHDACGRVVSRTVPGRGVARYRYDAAGRVVESSDTWYGRRRYRYDAAGQLVEVVNGNGGVTRYDHDANGRPVAITDPLGHTTRRAYDAAGRCVAETDPLGRTTRAGYDAAGRQVWQELPSGERLEWSYDTAGRLAAHAVDGRTTATYERDVRERRVVVTDHTPEGAAIVHELQWNRRDQIVRRVRDGRAITWSYDADGHRTSMTTPEGHTTTYDVDAAGRVAVVDHPLLGRAVLERDVSGRLERGTAGEIVQTWQHRDGFVVGHSVSEGGRTSQTAVTRGDDGRITAIDRDGAATAYTYDLACQLVEARVGGSVSRWTYDAAGRLVAESVDGATREHAYDAAGQLVETREPDGRTVRHDYDASGRRVRTEHADGRVRELGWGPTGRLASIADHVAGEVRRTALDVDALGELASVDGVEVHWDSSDGYAPTLLQVGAVPVVGAGPFTGIGASWAVPGWRDARSQAADPWAVEAAGVGAGLPEGLGLGGAGELTLGLRDPLEWLHARVYDPASRGFLSVDPLDPVAGAGWAGNPYSYAGNDPLHALDPTGLRPATDADIQAYKDAHNGWIKDNWEYLAGGAMVLAGGVMMATGVGGPVGLALVSAGADTIIQKATTGSVNWGQVAVSGSVGLVTGGVGGWLGMAGKGGAQALRTSMAVNAGIGSVSSTGSYVATGLVTDPGSLSWRGAAGAFVGGGLAGAVGGAAGPTGGTIARNLNQSSTGVVARVGSGGLNFLGGYSGSVTSQYVGTGEVNHAAAAFSGGVNAAGGDIMGQRFPSRGTSTLDSNSYFGPRTVNGVMNVQAPNTSAMLMSGAGGASIGMATDVTSGVGGWFD